MFYASKKYTNHKDRFGRIYACLRKCERFCSKHTGKFPLVPTHQNQWLKIGRSHLETTQRKVEQRIRVKGEVFNFLSLNTFAYLRIRASKDFSNLKRDQNLLLKFFWMKNDDFISWFLFHFLLFIDWYIVVLNFY